MICWCFQVEWDGSFVKAQSQELVLFALVCSRGSYSYETLCARKNLHSYPSRQMVWFLVRLLYKWLTLSQHFMVKHKTIAGSKVAFKLSGCGLHGLLNFDLKKKKSEIHTRGHISLTVMIAKQMSSTAVHDWPTAPQATHNISISQYFQQRKENELCNRMTVPISFILHTTGILKYDFF